jgi:hypothetical protein
LYEFANDLDAIKNKEEFAEKIKLISMRRGMKISIPYGMKQGTFYVQCSGYHFNSMMSKDMI